jgi:RNA polymerase sigma-70 factor (ECF subfamily)
VVTEAFRTVWQNVTPAGEGYAGLMPYLLRVAGHRAIDRLRSRRRRSAILAGAAEFHREPTAPHEPTRPGIRVAGAHPGARGARCAAPDQRAAVQLAYFAGLTQSEIAAQLGIRSAR